MSEIGCFSKIGCFDNLVSLVRQFVAQPCDRVSDQVKHCADSLVKSFVESEATQSIFICYDMNGYADVIDYVTGLIYYVVPKRRSNVYLDYDSLGGKGTPWIKIIHACLTCRACVAVITKECFRHEYPLLQYAILAARGRLNPQHFRVIADYYDDVSIKKRRSLKSYYADLLPFANAITVGVRNHTRRKYVMNEAMKQLTLEIKYDPVESEELINQFFHLPSIVNKWVLFLPLVTDPVAAKAILNQLRGVTVIGTPRLETNIYICKINDPVVASHPSDFIRNIHKIFGTEDVHIESGDDEPFPQ
jgi:hypothetical protein